MYQPKFPRVTQFLGRNLSIDDFQLIKKLGKGTYGQVCLYRHLTSGKQYAIKRIQLSKQGKKNDRAQIEMLTKKQLQILYKIDNEHIIKLLDHFQDKQAVYLITEFIQGDNLYDLTLKISRRYPHETVADIIYQILCGLEELHAKHIIHRDIKLQNIMYGNDFVKIVDLGCSNFYGDNISRQTTIGTRLYWSPEIIAQEEQNDRLDVWCVGVLLYQILYLEEPFTGNDIQKKIRKCEYSFPGDIKPEPQLLDLFQRIFTNKNNRIKSSELKRHSWIRKHRKHKQISANRFEDYFTEEQTQKYRQFLRSTTASGPKYLEQIKSRTDKLQTWLKQARRQLKKK